MFKNKIISFFLALLMMVQMVPVEQIGAMLCSNQWTEEFPHDIDETGKDSLVKFNHPYLPLGLSANSASFAFETKSLAYLHFSQQIPFNHSTEVVSPPPDSNC